jgi:hypothetical protein
MIREAKLGNRNRAIEKLKRKRDPSLREPARQRRRGGKGRFAPLGITVLRGMGKGAFTFGANGEASSIDGDGGEA